MLTKHLTGKVIEYGAEEGETVADLLRAVADSYDADATLVPVAIGLFLDEEALYTITVAWDGGE